MPFRNAFDLAAAVPDDLPKQVDGFRPTSMSNLGGILEHRLHHLPIMSQAHVSVIQRGTFKLVRKNVVLLERFAGWTRRIRRMKRSPNRCHVDQRLSGEDLYQLPVD